MDYFGDVSGHLHGLLHGDCDACVFGVVGGDRIAAGRCPKQAIRRADDIPEARWNDMPEVQKRRFFDCLIDQQDMLTYGYAVIRQEHLETLDKYHLLYQDVEFDIDWDLAFTGYVYGEILFEMNAQEDRRPTFTFDRVASKKQCEQVVEHLQEFISNVKPFYAGSRQEYGIQTADCLAGAIAEDERKGTNWREQLDDGNVVENAKSTALIQLENSLVNHSAGP